MDYLPGSILNPNMPWNVANAAKELASAYGYSQEAGQYRDAGFSGASLAQILQALTGKTASDLQRRQQDITSDLEQGALVLKKQALESGMNPFSGGLYGGYGKRSKGKRLGVMPSLPGRAAFGAGTMGQLASTDGGGGYPPIDTESSGDLLSRLAELYRGGISPGGNIFEQILGGG